MYFYLMAKALKNEVVLDFLENLKMGERVIQEIKNKEKEKYMYQYTDSNGKPIKSFNEKGVEDEKIEIIVPKGYELIQEGLNIEFVKKPDDRFMKWEDKNTLLAGCFVSTNSELNYTSMFNGTSSRNHSTRNTFKKTSQGLGSICLAMLSQQLYDVNGDWEPDWGNKNETKYCIYRRCRKNSPDEFTVYDIETSYSFLAFKTELDAKEFLDTNIKEIRLAKDFI